MARPADNMCSRHLSVVNDIWNYEKGPIAAKTAHKEGDILCTSVAILAGGTELSIPAAKRMLYEMVREWELRYKELSEEVLAGCNTPSMKAYLEGLSIKCVVMSSGVGRRCVGSSRISRWDVHLASRQGKLVWSRVPVLR